MKSVSLYLIFLLILSVINLNEPVSVSYYIWEPLEILLFYPFIILKIHFYWDQILYVS